MARVKRPAIRGDDDDRLPTRRSLRRRAATRPPPDQPIGDPELIDLEDDEPEQEEIITKEDEDALLAAILNPNEENADEGAGVGPAETFADNVAGGTQSQQNLERVIFSSNTSVGIDTRISEETFPSRHTENPQITRSSNEGENNRPTVRTPIPDLNMNAESEVLFSDFLLSMEEPSCPSIDELLFSNENKPQLLMLTWPFDETQSSPQYHVGDSFEGPVGIEMTSLEREDVLDSHIPHTTDVVASPQHQENVNPTQTNSNHAVEEVPFVPRKRKARNAVDIIATNISGTNKKKGGNGRKPPVTRAPKTKRARPSKKSTVAASDVQTPPGPSRSHINRRPNKTLGGFSCKQALERYEKLKKKPAHVDKGFNQRSVTDFPFIKKIIDEKGWGKFCEVSSSYNLTLVREFYAEFPWNQESVVTIRGIGISVNDETLNKFLGLTPPETTDYETFLNSATERELDKMLETVGKPETTWEPSPNFRNRTFKAMNLLPDANVWIAFIKSSIIPTTHDNSVTCERLILLYCLMAGKTINLGELLMKTISYSANRNQGKLYLPCLLTKFLTAGGVPQYEEDVIRNEDHESLFIDAQNVSRLMQLKQHSTDVLVLLKELLSQNSSLIEGQLQQGLAFDKQIAELKQELKEIKRTVRMNKGGLVRKMGNTIDTLKAVNQRLERENEKLRKSLTTKKGKKDVAASSSATAGLEAIVAAAMRATDEQDVSPTPLE